MSSNTRRKFKKRDDGQIFCPKCNNYFEESHFLIYPWNNTIKIKCKIKEKEDKNRTIIDKRGFQISKYRGETRNTLQDNGDIYCFKCDNVFNKEHFSIYKNSRTGELNQYCCKKHDRRFAKNSKNKQEKSNFCHDPSLYKLDMELQTYYKITLDRYNEIFEEQKGCCAICKKHQIEFKRRLFVDHNHDTGKVRGLLCNKCNGGIGLLGDSINTVENALTYLKIHNK